MSAACSVKNTGRLPCSVSVQEGILFRIGKCFSKLDNNVIFQIKGIVIMDALFEQEFMPEPPDTDPVSANAPKESMA